jgi:plastocyanin
LLNVRQNVAKKLGFVTVAGALMLGSAAMISAPGTSAHEGVTHPAHIHLGTCATPGDVEFPLTNAGAPVLDDAGTPMATEQSGSADAVPVDVSMTTVQSSLADLLGGERAIVVHESDENIGNYILCGDLGGTTYGGTDLVLGLAALNDSGASGVALLHDNGDGTTEVSLFVITAAAGEMGDHDMDDSGSSDADADAATGETVEVSIADFAYGEPLEIAVGTTVTWTNNDSVAHTVTQSGGEGFQSGKMDAGATFSYTFTEAGTFDYFCEYHANMASTITVK